MAYRCIHCGGYTGDTMQEAQKATGHGVGVCVSPCRYCNEGVPHAPHVCANMTVEEDGELSGNMSDSVWDFVSARRNERGHIAGFTLRR